MASRTPYYTLLQRLGIGLAIVTVLAEGGCVAILVIAEQTLSPVVFLSFIASIILGMCICLLWLGFPPPPDSPTSEKGSPQQVQMEEIININTDIRAFSVAKEGIDASEGDDKYAWGIQQKQEGQSLRCAVADGVSTSFLSAHWAHIVVNSFVAQTEEMKDPQQIVAWLSSCSREWQHWLTNIWIPRANQLSGRERDWNSERARGAQTTLVACSLPLQYSFSWNTTFAHIIAIGDTNAFLLQPIGENQWQYRAFPHEHVEDFDSSTYALTTSEEYLGQTIPLLKRMYYPVQRGDCLVIATDALAKWILSQIEQGKEPWPVLLAIDDQETFSQFVQEERQAELDLDDTTLLMISLK